MVNYKSIYFHMFIFQQKTGRGGNREVTIHNNISTDIYDQNTFHRYLKLFWLQIQTGNLATYISSSRQQIVLFSPGLIFFRATYPFHSVQMTQRLFFISWI